MTSNAIRKEEHNNSSHVSQPCLYIVGSKPIKYNKDGSVNQSKCHKQSGKDSEVYAFRTAEEIETMIQYFDNCINHACNPTQRKIACRNKLLFIVGINVGIRGSDLRTIQWSFFFHKVNNNLEWNLQYVLQPMKQRNQKKFVKLFFNEAVHVAVETYIKEYPIEDLDDYVFTSRKGTEPIEAKSIGRIVKDAAAEVGIQQNIGAHSLRKSFGFWCWHESKDKDKALVILQQIFNHSSTLITAKYIGITDNEIQDMFNSIDLGLDFI